jgi:preprotein translocase subunit SecF
MDKTKNTDVIDNLNSNYKERVFDFIGKRKLSFIIVVLIFAVGMTSFFVRGFNWDIDFVGGTILEYNLNKNVSSEDTERVEAIARSVVGDDNFSSVTTSGTQGVSIKTKQIDSDKRDEVTEALSAEFNIDADGSKAQNVDPTVGQALTRSTIIAVTLALALMLVYITIRFKFFSGLSTVICLTHDMFVALTFYSLLQIPMNMTVIAAFLTILAYSINTTIIIFDRVRENLRLLKGSDMSFGEIINKSVNQTLSRSINTTLTTIFVLGCVYIIGVPSIKEFVLPIIVGILAGVFSSLFLAGTLWDLFDGLKNKDKKAKPEKAE